MTNKNNPILIVEPSSKDHRTKEVNMGANKVFGDGASIARRKKLASETDEVKNYLKSQFEIWPNIPGVAKITLKYEALAKSHRPTALFTNSTCPIIGSLDFGEILVSVTPKGLNSLKRKILETSAKNPTANISAIEKIEPFSELERLHNHSWSDLEEKIKNNYVKLSIFDHQNNEENKVIEQALFKLAKNYEMRLRTVKYGRTKKVYVAEVNNQESKKALEEFIGLRSVLPLPYYQPFDTFNTVTLLGQIDEKLLPAPDISKDYPVVGIIDSGVCPNSTCLDPWIVSRESYVPSGDEDYSHGTMVASLIVNSRSLNHGDNRFPESQAKIVDVNVFPKSGNVSEEDLIAIIEEIVPKYPKVKIWNLSLGASNPVSETAFSDFACFLDEMHDRHGCLFIIASGNQNNQKYWPTMTNDKFSKENRLSAPSDSIRGLTVGSLAHKDNNQTLVKSEQVSPFSRIGPGPCFIPKPEVTHYGGNNCIKGGFAQTGILGVGEGNHLCEMIGTSFATPIVSSLAAQIYHFLSKSEAYQVTPEMVKALIIHSALMSNTKAILPKNLSSYGFGKPQNIENILYNDNNAITLFFSVDVRHGGGIEFEKVPFPMADCLLTADGKFKGEILMTLVYSPLTNSSFSSEYCRTNVDVGMGSYEFNDKNIPEFKGLVPANPKNMNEKYEEAQIKNGFKWSPVKAYYKRFPRGVNVKTWRLKMKVTRRAEDALPKNAQNATLILTLKAFDDQLPVYAEMLQKLRSTGWITHPIDQHVKIKV